MQVFTDKVALVSQYVPPLIYGSAARAYRLFREVDPAGYCVVTGAHLAGDLQAGPEAHRLAGAYHFLPSEWRRVPPEWPGERSSFAAWLNVWLKIMQRARNVLRILRAEGCRKVVSFTGDLEDIPAAWLAARRAKCDFYPVVDDDYIAQWSEPHKVRIARQIGPVVFRRSTKVFTVSAPLADDYRVRYGCEGLALPTPLMQPVSTPLAGVPIGGAGDEIRVLFSGSVYGVNADVIACLIRAAALVDERRVTVHLYTFQSRDELKAMGIDGTYVLHDSVSPERIQEIQRSSDILFLGLGFDPRHAAIVRTSFPSKLTDYLASGRPVLALLPANACSAAFLRTRGCAHVVDTLDAASLAAGIRRLICDDGYRVSLVHRALEVAAQEFDANIVVKQFVDAING